MPLRKTWLQHPFFCIAQHIAFWALSFIVFIRFFKSGASADKVDLIYTALFHITVLPAVYIHLYWLLPFTSRIRGWLIYLFCAGALVLCFSWLNYMFFEDWSKYLLKDYFFISYFTWSELIIIFLLYLTISSLLKLSKSWFTVSELQRRLLITEKEKVQMELRALKSQINPHFFFNTLNGIYSMSLEKDERLPQTVLQLSHLMRYLLYEAREDLVPLEKEWQVLQDYIALQKIRSGENLLLEITVPGEIQDQQIAPLLLITFLENAFKHAAKANTGPVLIKLQLQVQGSDFHFRLENTKGTDNEVEQGDHKGLGLENVQRRLELLYPGRHQLDISDTDDTFIVNLQLKI